MRPGKHDGEMFSDGSPTLKPAKREREKTDRLRDEVWRDWKEVEKRSEKKREWHRDERGQFSVYQDICGRKLGGVIEENKVFRVERGHV